MSTHPSSTAKLAQEALGVRLRELRKDAGLSGRALAAVTGQHPTRVSKIEHGVQAPSDENIHGVQAYRPATLTDLAGWLMRPKRSGGVLSWSSLRNTGTRPIITSSPAVAADDLLLGLGPS